MTHTVLVASFSLWLKGKRTSINGMIEPLEDYLTKHKWSVDFIEGMHPGSSDVITLIGTKTSIVSLMLKPFLLLFNKNRTQILFKIRDFLSVFEWIIRTRHRYALFIGLESVYTAAGIILKKLGLVECVVYYVSDYAPQRYGDTLFNTMYLALDRFCSYHADFIWDVSKAFHPARIKAGLDEKKSAINIHVPNALFPKQIAPWPSNKRIPYSLVFAGTLNVYNGPDIAVETIQILLNKYPDSTLHIYGTNGNDQARVMEKIKSFNIGTSVFFHGLITDTVKLSHTINKYMIGIAPYVERKDSHRAFGDATKLRLYAGAALAIITTHVPPLGRELSLQGAAICTNDTPQEIAKAIEKLFINKPLYESIRNQALKYAKSNTWTDTYSNAFITMNL